MVIQHNMAAMSAHRSLGINNAGVSKNLEKLSSGYKVNRAGDDAAGLAISEKMRGQIRGLGMAEQNCSHAINLIQTAEGALQETHELLQRMRELAVQSSNGTYQDDVDRANLDKEFQALKDEVDRISQSTEYNRMKLFEATLNRVVTAIDTTPDASGVNDAMRLRALLSDDDASLNYGGTAHYTHDQSRFGVVNPNLGGYTDTSYSPRFMVDIIIDSQGTVSSVELIWQENNSVDILILGTTVRVQDTATQAWVEFGVHDSMFTNWDFAGGTLLLTTHIMFGYGGLQPGYGVQYQPLSASNTYYKWDQGNKSFDLQIGANGSVDQHNTLQMHTVDSASLSIDATEVADSTDANAAISSLDNSINEISSFRADLGAMQNRLEHTMNNLATTRENLTAAESAVRDSDMAAEMMQYTKQNILVQASQAMLAQAQTLPQGILNLLR